MKTAFYIEGNPKNPGGYNQTINTTKFLSFFLNSDLFSILFWAKKTELGWKSIKYDIKQTIFMILMI